MSFSEVAKICQQSVAPDDYEENGLIMCGRCKTPKQHRVTNNGKSVIVSIQCKCQKIAEEEHEARKKRERFDNHMKWLHENVGVSDLSYRRFTFALDDGKDARASAFSKRYVEKWESMLAEGFGIMFFGSVGSGKSFLACAIANALIEKQVPATVTNFPRLLNIIQGRENRQEFIDRLQKYKLLVLDDLGVERDSPFACEQVYNVIDSRAQSGLPLIVTTNLSLDEMQNPANMQLKRIYDRIMEMCPIRIKLAGESRRVENAAKRAKKAQEILTE